MMVAVLPPYTFIAAARAEAAGAEPPDHTDWRRLFYIYGPYKVQGAQVYESNSAL